MFLRVDDKVTPLGSRLSRGCGPGSFYCFLALVQRRSRQSLLSRLERSILQMRTDTNRPPGVSASQNTIRAIVRMLLVPPLLANAAHAIGGRAIVVFMLVAKCRDGDLGAYGGGALSGAVGRAGQGVPTSCHQKLGMPMIFDLENDPKELWNINAPTSGWATSPGGSCAITSCVPGSIPTSPRGAEVPGNRQGQGPSRPSMAMRRLAGGSGGSTHHGSSRDELNEPGRCRVSPGGRAVPPRSRRTGAGS